MIQENARNDVIITFVEFSLVLISQKKKENDLNSLISLIS